MVANIPELNTRVQRDRPGWSGPMTMPTMPAPAGPTSAMAARRTMPVNDRSTRLPIDLTEPNHQASTARSSSTQKVASMHEAVDADRRRGEDDAPPRRRRRRRCWSRDATRRWGPAVRRGRPQSVIGQRGQSSSSRRPAGRRCGRGAGPCPAGRPGRRRGTSRAMAARAETAKTVRNLRMDESLQRRYRSLDGWEPVGRVSHAPRCATMITSLVRLNAPSGIPSPTKGTP